jgi:hypothetical protein
MEAENSLLILLQNPHLPADLKQIAEKVRANERITFDEGVLLYETGELGYLGVLANYLREKRHGNKTYFNRNFHIEPTNLCVYDCKFCSYSRLIKQKSEGWEYTMEEMLDIVKKYDGEPVTEVHIVGGVLPQYDVAFYSELFRRIKEHRPELHVKALTPVEYHYIFKKAKIDYATGSRSPAEERKYSTRRYGSRLPKTNAMPTNGWLYTRNGINWERDQMQPCCMAISKSTGTGLTTWNGCASYRIKPVVSKLLSR